MKSCGLIWVEFFLFLPTPGYLVLDRWSISSSEIAFFFFYALLLTCLFTFCILFFFSWLILSVSQFDSKVARAGRAIGAESWGGPWWSFNIKNPFRGFPFYLLSCRFMKGMNECTATSVHLTFLSCWSAADTIFSQYCSMRLRCWPLIKICFGWRLLPNLI